ncbi:MAG TPA: hypothetical protein VFV71_06570 [Burkholderiales bacterium]|nr:hypothetical protein [Burkholderiales bacterium]
MFARLNFLLSFGLLILLAFHFTGTYLVVGPLSAVAPGLARGVAGALVLLAVGMTVQGLATAATTLDGVAKYSPERPAGMLAWANQTLLGLGHAAVLYAFMEGSTGDAAPVGGALAAAALLYLAGTGLAVAEWKRRGTR